MLMDDFYYKRMEEMRAGIIKYLYIMDNLKSTKVDVYKSEFQKKYNGFYRVRQKSENWYRGYYNFLEANKNNLDLTFNIVLLEMYRVSGCVETSFSSKLLHTVNPNMPIYDALVVRRMGIKPVKWNKNKTIHLTNSLETYNQIVDIYSKYFQTQNCREAIYMFDSYFPEFKRISDVKKIDFFLWKFEKDELKKLGFFNELLGD